MKKFMVCAAFAFAMVALGTVNAQNAAKDSKAKTEQCCKKGGDKKYDEKEYKEPLFTVKYKGTTPEGVVFDDSGDKAVDFPLQLIPGFTEALKAMPISGRSTNGSGGFSAAQMASNRERALPKALGWLKM